MARGNDAGHRINIRSVKRAEPSELFGVVAIGIPPASQRALSGDHRALIPMILWGIVLVAGVIFTIVLYQRWRRPWPIYLMTTPVLLAVAVLCFGSLAQLLPATM